MFVKYQVFLSLGPVEELEVLQPTCTASRLLFLYKIEGYGRKDKDTEMHTLNHIDTSWSIMIVISRIAEPDPVESK